jgi:hypothetical protein
MIESPTVAVFLVLAVGITVGLFTAAAMSATTVRRAEDRARCLELAAARCYGFLRGHARGLEHARRYGDALRVQAAADELGAALGPARPTAVDLIEATLSERTHDG